MADNILSILILLLVVAVGWTVIKLVFKLTTKIFSCGCLVLVIIVGLIFVASFFNLAPPA